MMINFKELSKTIVAILLLVLVILFDILMIFIKVAITVGVVFLAIYFIAWLILGIDLINIITRLLS